MKAESHSSTISAILHQKCPRCHSGAIFRSSIFRGLVKMNERCPVCDLKFEREEGYFLGAMYISYGLALIFIIGLAGLLWALLHWSIRKSVISAVLLFLRSEEHTSELQSRLHLVCRLLLEKKKTTIYTKTTVITAAPWSRSLR